MKDKTRFSNEIFLFFSDTGAVMIIMYLKNTSNKWYQKLLFELQNTCVCNKYSCNYLLLRMGYMTLGAVNDFLYNPYCYLLWIWLVGSRSKALSYTSPVHFIKLQASRLLTRFLGDSLCSLVNDMWSGFVW